MSGLLSSLLQHPLTIGLDVDDPETTSLRRTIMREKGFLSRMYKEWYGLLKDELPAGDDLVIELGSGAGFIKDIIPGVVTTDILDIDGVDCVLPEDGSLPFDDQSLRGIVMTDVLHHIPTPRLFFKEATRAVRSGGVIVMIEPWVTSWSTLVHKMHYEPFRPESEEWEFPPQGPLSGANGAIPWMMFKRDREQFEKEFPEWEIEKIKLLMPVTYLVSGGISFRSLSPGWAYGLCRTLERCLGCLGNHVAMFGLIKLTRR